jgi:predicted MPP superfamily phosphohydrolase
MLGVFLLIVGSMAAGDVLWWWWADRRIQSIGGRRIRRQLGRAVVGAFVAMQLSYLAYFIVAPVSARRSHDWVPAPLLASIYLWHILVLPPSVVAILMAAAVRNAVRLVRRRPRPQTTEPAAAGLSRRSLLGGLAVAAPPLALAAVTAEGMAQLGNFRIRRLDVAVPGLPPGLDGLTIAHVTDIHIGRFTRPRMLPKIIDATNALRVDLVLLTGDLIDLSLSDLPAAIDFVRKLDPRHGLVMCEGNHDLIESREAFEDGVKWAGLPLLTDEATTVRVRGNPVQVLAIRWNHGSAGVAASVDAVRPLLRPDAFPILLAHHPHAFDPAAEAGFPLVLSGHTHGGQLMLNERLGAGPVMFRYWSGLYQKPASRLVVSNGVGNWFPLRTHAPAEIIHLTLHRPHGTT